jgi:prolyl 4-hydroxylase
MRPRPNNHQLTENNVLVRDDFLDPAARRQILDELGRCQWKASETVNLKSKGQRGRKQDSGRVSMTVTAGEWPTNIVFGLGRIEQSLARQFGIVGERLEEWQATRYMAGDSFDFHLDCGCFAKDPAGERRTTIMIFLDRPLQGGGTFFRALNLEIKAVAGRIVLWNNLLANGNCNHAMIHAGLPVIRGVKTILITWERQRRYARKY